MRTVRPRHASFIAAALLAALAHADPSAMAEAKHEASLYRTALMRKDFAAIDRDMAPGVTFVYPGGQKVTKARFMANTEEFFGPLTITRLKVAVPSAKGSGGAQDFIMDFAVEGTMKMKGKGPKPSFVKNHAVFELHRTKKGGAWIVDSGRCLKMDTTVDGKPMR